MPLSSDSASVYVATVQVLVMDAGRVKEFDTVPALMSQPTSSFRAMVNEAGLNDQA